MLEQASPIRIDKLYTGAKVKYPKQDVHVCLLVLSGCRKKRIIVFDTSSIPVNLADSLPA